MTVKHSNLPNKIRIGSRGSPLALAQVELVRCALQKVAPQMETELVVIKTSGDWTPAHGEVALEADNGGKGQFAKEIEEALLAGEIDCAVHSMKDMETDLPGGLMLEHMLPREDARDALLCNSGAGLDDLKDGAIVGTVSPRRSAFLKELRPDLKIVPIRGNVQTRIDKLQDGMVDATMLACAGLNRLGLSGEISEILDVERFLPSGGQGAVGIELRIADIELHPVFAQISCEETVLCVMAERAVLDVLGGSCHTPIGVHAVLDGTQIYLRARLVSLDGRHVYLEEARENVISKKQARDLGARVGAALKEKVPHDLLNKVA